MKCPFCTSLETKVVDKRENTDSTVTRRRRECLNEKCAKRFTTYEHIELAGIMVIKKDGTRQPFDREKIKQGILKACEKRSVKADTIDELVANVEAKILESGSNEISSVKLGEWVIRLL